MSLHLWVRASLFSLCRFRKNWWFCLHECVCIRPEWHYLFPQTFITKHLQHSCLCLAQSRLSASTLGKQMTSPSKCGYLSVCVCVDKTCLAKEALKHSSTLFLLTTANLHWKKSREKEEDVFISFIMFTSLCAFLNTV